jgi:hypothetical protein
MATNALGARTLALFLSIWAPGERPGIVTITGL